ncbi:MAG: hypothetical protein WCC64_19985 [Aliidongia sp.]
MTRTSPEGLFADTTPGSSSTGQDSPKIPHNAALAGKTPGVHYLRVKGKEQYININSSGWAEFGSAGATQFQFITYEPNHYIQIYGGVWDGYYLSYNNNSYVGVYKAWHDACYWSVEPEVNCTPYPGMYPSGTSVCVNGNRDANSQVVIVVGQ